MSKVKSLAIMQPYFLPYIGYFQLMAAVDKFVIFDDINYINRGWVNRNRLLLHGQPHTFTVPLRGGSQNRRICEIELDDSQHWRGKLLRTIRQSYSKAPHFSEVFPLLEGVINFQERRLDHFLRNSLCEVVRYLSLDTEVVSTSSVYQNAHFKGQERILDICRLEQANTYINSIGGMALYDRASFAKQEIALHFLQSRPISYFQGNNEFVPHLSIMDVLMFNELCVVRGLLAEIDLV